MKGREYKNIALEIKDLAEEEGFYTFKGYASTFGNIDRQDDIISKGAFAESLKNNTIAMLWQHDSSQPIGVFTKAFEDDKGLYVEGKMPKDDEFVTKRVMPQVRIGSVKSMSIGFITKDYEWSVAKKHGGEGNRSVRIIKSMDLLETSLVTIPANPQATIDAVKSLKMLDDIDIDDTLRKDIKDKLQKKMEENGTQLDIKEVSNIECMKDIENILKVRAGLSQSERKTLISKIKSYSRDVQPDTEPDTSEIEMKKWLEDFKLEQTLKNIISQSKE